MHQNTKSAGNELCASSDFPVVTWNRCSDFEKNCDVPESIGKGSTSIFSIKPGLDLEIGDYEVEQPTELRNDVNYESVIFGFSLLGDIKISVDGEKGKGDFWLYKEGCSTINYQSTWKGTAGLHAGRERSVCISVDHKLLADLFDERGAYLPEGLQNAMSDSRGRGYYHEAVMPFCIQLAVQQMIYCPYQASLKRVFLEGKALELIAYGVSQCSVPETAPRRQAALKTCDIDRAHDAKKILMQCLENPPSLVELARQLGTNKTTLNKGFRDVYGVSPFEFMRVNRLERARELLQSKTMSVTEVAFQMGYAQQCSFTKAYKKHFGTTPQSSLSS